MGECNTDSAPGLVLVLIAFVLVMLLGATYWRWLGYQQTRKARG